ncbi:hypothetical protein V6N11_015775 [Hibiscus sabdariffa]|uniref:Pentatricopeptide repeat-containing protein n=1 Tax=Hibiscus sabdariffa TaxID=183260 RepID=A0ABR2TT45_9ROSI
MLRSECSAYVTVYHNLIYGLCKAWRMDDADGILSKFKHISSGRSRKILPVLTWKTKDAMKLFNYMSFIYKILPKTTIYNILIESFCKNTEVDVVLPLMEYMKAKGVKPDTTTYNAKFKGKITMEILTEWFSAVGELENLKSFKQGDNVPTSTTENGFEMKFVLSDYLV